MIKIKIDNEFLDTKEDLTIPFEFYTNALEFEKLYNSRSFSFSLPKTAKNFRLLKYENFEEQSVTVELNLIDSFEGTLIKKTSTENEFSVDIQLKLSTFFDKLSTFNISELFPSFSESLAESNLNANVAKLYPDVNFYCPTLIFTTSDFNAKILNFYNNSTYERDFSTKFIHGFFALGFIVQKVVEFCGYYVVKNCFIDDSFLKRLFLIHIYSNSPSAYEQTFVNGLPSMPAIDFIKSIIKIFGIRFDFNNGNAAISLMNKLYQPSNSSIVNLTDIKTNTVLTPYKSVKYSNLWSNISYEINYNFPRGENELLLQFDYQIYKNIDYVSEMNKSVMFADSILDFPLKLGIYKYVDAYPTALYSDDKSLDFDANNIFYSYILKSIMMRNTFLKKIQCTIHFNAAFLFELYKINSFYFENQLYLIEKISGNLTGKEIQTMSLNAYLIE